MRFGDERIGVVGIGGTMREGSSSLGALRRALATAEDAGAHTELLDLRELDLPMYEPGRPAEDYGGNVGRFVEALRGADAAILSTAAYHGTLAGVTKNALDFAQFLAHDERPYLDGRVIGLISTAGGDLEAARSVDAQVHALRGVVAPLTVAIPKSWQRSDESGNITDGAYGARLEKLGRLVVELAERLSPGREAGRDRAVGLAS